MPRPVIVAVDDAPDRLSGLVHVHDDRYGRHYDVRGVETPARAIACFEELVATGTEIAVLLVAVPVLSAEGSGLLDEARRLHPHSKRALIINWSDTGNRVIAMRSSMRL